MLLPPDLGQQKGLWAPRTSLRSFKNGELSSIESNVLSHPDGLTPKDTFPLLPLPTPECTLPFTAEVVSIKERASFKSFTQLFSRCLLGINYVPGTTLPS